MASWGTTLLRGPFGQDPFYFQTFEEIAQEKNRNQMRQWTFVSSVIDGNKSAVKTGWKELHDHWYCHDLHALLDQVKPYTQKSHLKDEYRQWLAKWITKTESKLDEADARAIKYRQIGEDLLSAAGRLELDGLQAAAEQMQEIYISQPDLSPCFFQTEWKKAKDIVQNTRYVGNRAEVLSFINDAVQRIESKKALQSVIYQCSAWNSNLKELSKKIEAIYADRAALFPRSPQTIESDWKAAKESADLLSYSKDREYALVIISKAEEQLQKGWEPFDADDGFL